jgi:DNA replication protein DnaC
MNGSEAIKIIGKNLYKDFSIDKDPLHGIYKTVYENFISGLVIEDNSKGVILIGSKGNGKTAMMRIMQKLFIDTQRKFKWVNGSEFKKLMDDYSVSEIMTMYGKSCRMDLYIDDIGTDNTTGIKKFGNETNLISEIIMERYDLFIQTGIKTHLSSNLPTRLDKAIHPNVATLVDGYGDRVVDRIKEMCETIIFKGESLRK